MKIRFGSVIIGTGSADPDPDPYQNETDPQHCYLVRVPLPIIDMGVWRKYLYDFLGFSTLHSIYDH